jgi:hypothetical protein
MWRTVAATVGAAALVMTGGATAQASSTTAAKDAVVVGELGVEGGAYPGGFHPTPGVVEVSFRARPLVLVTSVGASGHFRIRLAPGTYTVTGCGGASASGPCSKPVTVRLKAGQTDHLQLVWAQVP